MLYKRLFNEKEHIWNEIWLVIPEKDNIKITYWVYPLESVD